jgi:hypothetical protein
MRFRRKEVKISELSPNDVGRWVVYNNGFGEERGKIKSWNNENIFVVYKCNEDWNNFENYTAIATRPQDLEFEKDIMTNISY